MYSRTASTTCRCRTPTRRQPSASRAEPFDYFHINSVDVGHEGDLLIDARNTWAAYDVDAEDRTGALGAGRQAQQLRAGAGNGHRVAARRALAAGRRDHVLRQRRHPAGPPAIAGDRDRVEHAAHDSHAGPSGGARNSLVSGSQGNVQALPNGDWMIGWGEAGYLSEVDPSRTGAVRRPPACRAGSPTARTCSRGAGSRRSRRRSRSRRATAGSECASRASTATTVYASWNGATRWPPGVCSRGLADEPRAGRHGRATASRRRSRCRRHGGAYVAVQALDAAGAVLGVSAAGSRQLPANGVPSLRALDAAPAGRLRVRQRSLRRAAARRRGVPRGGEVVGEAARVRGGQAARQGRAQLLRRTRRRAARAASSSSALSPAPLSSSSRPSGWRSRRARFPGPA